MLTGISLTLTVTSRVSPAPRSERSAQPPTALADRSVIAMFGPTGMPLSTGIAPPMPIPTMGPSIGGSPGTPAHRARATAEAVQVGVLRTPLYDGITRTEANPSPLTETGTSATAFSPALARSRNVVAEPGAASVTEVRPSDCVTFSSASRDASRDSPNNAKRTTCTPGGSTTTRTSLVSPGASVMMESGSNEREEPVEASGTSAGVGVEPESAAPHAVRITESRKPRKRGTRPTMLAS